MLCFQVESSILFGALLESADNYRHTKNLKYDFCYSMLISVRDYTFEYGLSLLLCNVYFLSASDVMGKLKFKVHEKVPLKAIPNSSFGTSLAAAGL